MRSDLIAAGMVRSWLQVHAPHMLNGWNFEMTEEISGFVGRIKSILDDIDAQFVTQAALPRTALAYWNLEDVAVLGGGTPSPLAPEPDQVRYYTDINPVVVDEVAQLGYETRTVDIRNPDDLNTLSGARAALAIGLFHFLDEDAGRQALQNLYDTGFEQVVFNNMNRNVSHDLVENWAKLGYVLHRREPDEVQALMPAGWQMDEAIKVSDFLKHNPDLGQRLSETATSDLHYVYLLSRV